jgi:cinnamyl-alcohol dehydrogenase
MAVKFGKAFSMKVTVFSRSPSKEKEAREVLGADNFIVSKDPYLSTLKIDDRLVVVGIPDKPLSINALSLINGKPNCLNHNLALFCQSLTPHKFTGQGCFELHNA